MDEYKCKKCLKIYLRLKTLRSHIRLSHPDDSDAINELAPLPKRKFTCELCPKSYNIKKNLSKHERTVHSVEYIHLYNSYICPLCKQQHFQKYMLFEHFKNHHNIILELSEHKFETFQEFEIWKEEMQLHTKSKFIKNGNGGCSSKRKTKFIYYICHRSGQFNQNKIRKRKLKNQGSNKINGVCPASLTVKIEESGIISIRFLQTHVGHENDLCHLTLSLNERKAIAKKIESNVPFQVILDEVRESMSQGEIQRVHLLTKMDLANIKNKFKMDVCEIKEESDAISINASQISLEDEIEISLEEEIGDQTSLEEDIGDQISLEEEIGDQISLEEEIDDHISLEEEIDELNSEWNYITQRITSKQHLKTVKNHLKSIMAKLEIIDEEDRTAYPLKAS